MSLTLFINARYCVHQYGMSSLEVTCFIITTLCSVSVIYNNIFATDSMWVSIVMVVYLNIVIACDARRRVNVQTCG